MGTGWRDNDGTLYDRVCGKKRGVILHVPGEARCEESDRHPSEQRVPAGGLHQEERFEILPEGDRRHRLRVFAPIGRLEGTDDRVPAGQDCLEGLRSHLPGPIGGTPGAENPEARRL